MLKALPLAASSEEATQKVRRMSRESDLRKDRVALLPSGRRTLTRQLPLSPPLGSWGRLANASA
jgi:hypothetical protein